MDKPLLKMKNFTLVFLFVVVNGFNCHSQKLESKLTFIYWMPYDNNLSMWSDSIYQMIQSGLYTEDIIVTIQKDESDENGMTRSVITENGITNEKVDNECSFCGKAYDQYLSWVYEKVESQKYVIIFLDHGGKLDEIGLDESPVKSFLRIDSANWAIERFNKRNCRRAELLFLQVCTKGSVEPLFELKDAANFTMFSQTTLGAPNFYYTAFFKELSSRNIPDVNGLELAELLTKSERPDMYQSLVCVDNSKFTGFSSAFQDFLDAQEVITAYDFKSVKALFYYGQTYFDLVSFVQSFKGIESGNLLAAIDELVVLNKINPSNDMMNGYSGLSLLAMQRGYLEQINKYKHLQFFNTFEMSELYIKSKTLLKK